MDLYTTHQLQQVTQTLINATIDAGGPGSGRHPDPGTVVAKHFTDNGFKKTSSAKWGMAGPQPNYSHPDGHVAHVGKRGDWTVQSNTGRLRLGNPGDNAGLALGHLRDLGIAPQAKANLKAKSEVKAGGPGSGRKPFGSALQEMIKKHAEKIAR